MKIVQVLLIAAFSLIYKSSGGEKPGEVKLIEIIKIMQNCEYNGIRLYGKVKIVESFADLKVKVVSSFPDLKVKVVSSFADDCGEWQFVESFPDFTVQFVESFPDITIKYVESFPGMD